jgi:hypothetical protein
MSLLIIVQKVGLKLDFGEPFEEFRLPFSALSGATFLAGAKAMAACLKLDVTVVHMGCGQGRVEDHRVAVVNYRVVDAVGEENRRAVGWDMTFQ